jgi:NTP pyrophosphatase (non-canonical NTP hydrolase)
MNIKNREGWPSGLRRRSRKPVGDLFPSRVQISPLPPIKMRKKINNLRKYQRLCKRTAKKFKNREKEIMTWGLGVAGEAGDIAGCIKKTFAHNNDQRAGIRENIGDMLWYTAMICNYFKWDFDKILKENVEKLEKRYPKGFTTKNARRKGKRIDWNEK